MADAIAPSFTKLNVADVARGARLISSIIVEPIKSCAVTASSAVKVDVAVQFVLVLFTYPATTVPPKAARVGAPGVAGGTASILIAEVLERLFVGATTPQIT